MQKHQESSAFLLCVCLWITDKPLSKLVLCLSTFILWDVPVLILWNCFPPFSNFILKDCDDISNVFLAPNGPFRLKRCTLFPQGSIFSWYQKHERKKMSYSSTLSSPSTNHTFLTSPSESHWGGVPIVAQWLTNPTRNRGVVGLIPGLAQWVKDLVCCELWCKLQTWLRSRVAVALA